MKRSGQLGRSKRLKRVNGDRRARLRAAQFGPQAALCRFASCCVCSRRPAEPHHVVPRSRGGTDADCVPLCAACHGRGHAVGWATFESETGVDLATVAADLARIVAIHAAMDLMHETAAGSMAEPTHPRIGHQGHPGAGPLSSTADGREPT